MPSDYSYPVDAERLKKERHKTGMSQKKFARRAKLSENTYRKAERGEPVSTATIKSLCELLGVEFSVIVSSDQALWGHPETTSDKKEVDVVLPEYGEHSDPQELLRAIQSLLPFLGVDQIEILKAELGSVHLKLRMSANAKARLLKVCKPNEIGELVLSEAAMKSLTIPGNAMAHDNDGDIEGIVPSTATPLADSGDRVEVIRNIIVSELASDKPLIGVNTDYHSATHDRPGFSVVSGRYCNHIQTSGGIAFLMPPAVNDEDIYRALSRLDAFVLIGGADLDPRRDGFMHHPMVTTMDPRREDFDRRLTKCIASLKLPVLGIGAGMQLINVTMGGNLFLHIPEDVPTAHPHKDPHNPALRHGLEVVVSDSLMGRVFGKTEAQVNSMHHMAVDEVAPGFAVTARSPDGIIEAIEYQPDDWLAIGTQFHPEARSASALELRIFEEFVQSLRGTRDRVSDPLEQVAQKVQNDA